MAARDDAFLDGVYREHRRDLCAYVRRKFGAGPPEPEDVVQAAFTRFAALDNCREIPNPRAYLMLTARNLVIDAHRHGARGASAERQLAVIEENVHEFSAEDVLSSREELTRLAAIVSGLKPKERVALLMHRIDGLSYAEIARRMRVSEPGARLLVKRGMRKCIARMGERG
jgi:RNA polymerase sigma factor (sigma-70 family)